MLSLSQAVGMVISISLTIMVLFIGYHIVLILKEIHQGLKKINHIVNTTSKVVESVAEPVQAVTGIVSGFKAGSEFIKSFTKSASGKNKS